MKHIEVSLPRDVLSRVPFALGLVTLTEHMGAEDSRGYATSGYVALRSIRDRFERGHRSVLLSSAGIEALTRVAIPGCEELLAAIHQAVEGQKRAESTDTNPSQPAVKTTRHFDFQR